MVQAPCFNSLFIFLRQWAYFRFFVSLQWTSSILSSAHA